MSETDVNRYGKVAVLMGGDSGEREISLKSGAAVLAALQNSGVNATGIDVDEAIFATLIDGKYDRVFIALHGCGGEDGAIQGGLEMIKLPYTGSGVMASAICMNKLMTKQVWQSEKIATPDYLFLQDNASYKSIQSQLGNTFAIKPSNEGSSLGIHKISNQEEFESAVNDAKQFQGQLMAERWVEGDEYTVGIINGEALPVIKLQTSHEFYDYEAKYRSDDTQYLLPCGLAEQRESELKQLALKAFKATAASGWGRVDVMMDQQQQAWFLEINTVPGMTDHSLVPMAAAHQDISFDELVLNILDTSF